MKSMKKKLEKEFFLMEVGRRKFFFFTRNVTDDGLDVRARRDFKEK